MMEKILFRKLKIVSFIVTGVFVLIAGSPGYADPITGNSSTGTIGSGR